MNHADAKRTCDIILEEKTYHPRIKNVAECYLKLEQMANVLKDVLEKITREDFRGPRPMSSVLAYKALAKYREMQKNGEEK